jgi:hypothetical protein
LQKGQVLWANIGGNEVFILAVTCPSTITGLTFSENPAFVFKKILNIGKSNKDVYTILPPTIGFSNCLVETI